MTIEELEEFEYAIKKAATAGIVVVIIEVVLCFTLKKALNAMWILITAI